MRLLYRLADAAILSPLLFPFLTAADGSFDCSHVRDHGQGWNFKELGGPRSVLNSVDEGASWKNTTYTVDICKPLKRDDKVPENEKCPGNTRICAIERVINYDGSKDVLLRAIPIAGQLKGQGGFDMDAKWFRLKTSDSRLDSEKEGVRLTMNGGFSVDPETKKNRPQTAVIEFLCDKDRVGDENLWDPEDKYLTRMDKEEGEKEGDKLDDGPNSPSLRFVAYDTSKDDADVLQLSWRTKFACEDAKGEKDAEPNSHWGFFTWFIIIAFLSTATYLIFGSWLNYNRYGARGWDLLPHGDTIRDVPYLLREWTRRVLNTLQGGGSRGGYAAV